MIEPKAQSPIEETGFKIRGLRWVIIALIFFATLINYIDRLTISVLAPAIMEAFKLSNTEFGTVATWFLLAYTISQSASGKLYDKIGVKKGFTVSIIVWSVAGIATAWANGLRALSLCRFMLGFGEAGNWPGAAKTVSEWFPARQRALGMAIFNSGAAIGSIVATPIIIALYTYSKSRGGDWHEVFIVTGALGFVWLAAWLFVYDSPEKHKWITPEEYRLIKEQDDHLEPVAPPEATIAEEVTLTVPEERAIGWFELLTYRQTWSIILARLLVDPIWWLYITWLPLYLNQVHGFNLREIGYFAWVPFVAADAGSLFGGWLSGHLIGRGWSVNSARKAVIVFAACLMPAGILAAFTTSAMIALALIAVVLFGFQVWINNVQTLPSDMFPSKAVGSVAGLGGTGAGIGSMIFMFTTGWVTDNFSYAPILIVAGLLAPIGTIILFAFAGSIRRVPLADSRRSAG